MYDNAIDKILSDLMDKAEDKTQFIPFFKVMTEKFDDYFKRGQTFNGLQVLHTMIDVIDLFTSLDCIQEVYGRHINRDFKHNSIGSYVETILTIY